MKKYCFLLVFVLLACSPEKRLNKLLLKHPELLKQKYSVKIDTLVKLDTLFVPIKKDSFIVTSDTIIETKFFNFEKIGYKYKISTKIDTLIVHDTIFYKVKTTEKIVQKKHSAILQSIFKIFIIILLCFIFWFLINFIRFIPR